MENFENVFVTKTKRRKNPNRSTDELQSPVTATRCTDKKSDLFQKNKEKRKKKKEKPPVVVCELFIVCYCSRSLANNALSLCSNVIRYAFRDFSVSTLNGALFRLIR